MIIGLAINILFIFQVLLFVYILLTFFPLHPNGIVAQIRAILAGIYEPILKLMRRYIPPIGRVDISVLVLFLIIFVLQSVLGGLR